MIEGLDYVCIPSQDAERSRHFYGEVLELRPDEHSPDEFWAGETCFAVWVPEQYGMPFSPQKNGAPALRVGDVDEARKKLEAKGVAFNGDTFDTGVCHMAQFEDPDGNDLLLHRRYKPYE